MSLPRTGGTATLEVDGPDLHVVAERSYRYVRLSMVGLVVALAVAVVHQSVVQGELLASLSAYYYTPAQVVFAGALIGLGAAMIALRGTTDAEDVLLDLGGMLAAVVAVVPTSRGEDFRAAVRVCRDAGVTLLTDRVPSSADCPTVEALVAASRADVVNGMVALLATGLLALATTVVIGMSERRTSWREARRRAKLLWQVGLTGALYAGTLLAFALATDQFVDHAHYVAAPGLFLSVVLVVVANAVRRNDDADRGTGLVQLARHEGRGYLVLAVVMVGAAVVLGSLVAAGVLALFWLEAVLVVLFGVFWVAQTAEQWQRGRLDGAEGSPRPPRAG